MTTYYCLECDSTFCDENVCPYCGERNFDIADEDGEYPCAITDPWETSGPNSGRYDIADFDADDSGAVLHVLTEDAL